MSPIIERALVTWPLLVADAVMFGSGAFVLFMAPISDSTSAADTIARCWRWLAAINLVISPLALLVAVANMAGVPVGQALALVPEAMRETHVGRLWPWYLTASIVLMAATLAPLRTVPKAGSICALAGAQLLLRSLESHAIDKGASAVCVYFVHELAASLWVGALASLLLARTLRAATQRWFSIAAPRVSRLAAWSVAAITVTGAYTAFDELGWSWDRLFYSLYGRTLLWKLGTASLVLSLAAYNRYRLVPAAGEFSAQAELVRSVAAESVLLAGVLAWSALLANTPPPH